MLKNAEIDQVITTPGALQALDASFRLIGVEEFNTIEESSPRQKANLTGVWSNTSWQLISRLHYYGSAVRVFNFGGGFEPRQRYGSETALDLELVRTFSESLTFRLGSNNILDNFPDRSSADINFFGNLPHDVLSPIGVNGRYVYAQVQTNF